MISVDTTWCNALLKGNGDNVVDLPICVEKHESGAFIYSSFWKPTPEELIALNKGGVVMLQVLNNGTPPDPVKLLVKDV